jgi:hypothetical protein
VHHYSKGVIRWRWIEGYCDLNMIAREDLVLGGIQSCLHPVLNMIGWYDAAVRLRHLAMKEMPPPFSTS